MLVINNYLNYFNNNNNNTILLKLRNTHNKK